MNSELQNFFTSIHIEGSPQILLNDYNKRLIRSLSSLFDSIEKTLKIDLSELKNFLTEVDTAKKLNPKLYALHASFRQEINRGAVKIVLKLLKEANAFFKSEQIYANSFLIETCSSEAWEVQILKNLQEQNRNQEGKLPSLTPVGLEEIRSHSPCILQSLELLRQVSPLFYDEFETFVANLKLFQSNRLVGMTDVRVFGLIYLCLPNGSMPNEVYFCEHLIHETSHLYLHALFGCDKLVLNSPEERYTAPIRPDPRPMYGIFHATFVLSRMTRLFLLMAKDPVFEKYFEIFLNKFMHGYDTVQNFGKLTPLGEKIMESYSDILSLTTATHV